MASRHAFTASEDEILIDWALRWSRTHKKGITGNNIWQDLEKAALIEGRTWQAMRERVRRYLLSVVKDRIEINKRELSSSKRKRSEEDSKSKLKKKKKPVEDVEDITEVDSDNSDRIDDFEYEEDGIVYVPVRNAKHIPILNVVRDIVVGELPKPISLTDTFPRSGLFQPDPVVIERIKMGLNRLKRLCPYPGVTDNIVMHAVIVSGGDFNLAQQYLCGLPVQGIWSYEEDSVLMSDDAAETAAVIQRRGKDDVIKRINFLENESVVI